ncbi:Hypothetical predicted protein [Mytilus galloprovincialis]|uniref:C-type lectin domain-containing protein n=1 Tax=Mytilus galloprovincialis TaxID=29158 RepID=A0A8B6BZ06_MYTGA|nr:Hypothetical predicted protein [Mytilus galloprovincialis]
MNFINTEDRKVILSSLTLKIETAPSSIACSTLCCMLESCFYASYNKNVQEESCCPQNEFSGDALMMKKSTGSISCPNGWFKNDNKCYYFSDDTTNWNDAKSTCEAYGAMLIEVIQVVNWTL